MAKKEVTPESVDDMTDEQITELMGEMQADGNDEQGAGTKPEEPKAEAKPKKEPEHEQDQDDGDEPSKAETVDFKRFDYERNRRKEAEKRAAEKEAEWARRFDELMKSQKAPEKEEKAEPEIPGWEDDPFARMQSIERRLEEFMSGVKGQTEEQKAAQQQREQEQWAIATADQTFAKAAPQHPDIQEAMNFAIQAVQKELQTLGYYGPAFQQEYQRQIVNYAANAPQDPDQFAEYVRRNARYWGWSGQRQQGQAQSAATQQQDVSEAARKAKTLSNGGGSPGISDAITPEQLLNMSEKEFDAYIAKHGSVAAAFG